MTEAPPDPAPAPLDVADAPDDPTGPPTHPGGDGRVLLVGASPASRERLVRARIPVANEPAEAAVVSLVLISTRLPRGRGAALVRRLRGDDVAAPILALVHPGGEAEAVELQRAGADGALAEGGEASTTAYLDGKAEPERAATMRFQEAYEAQVHAEEVGGAGTQSVDPITLLPTSRQLEERLAEFTASGEPLRLALLRVRGWRRCQRRLGGDAEGVLRRRLAVQFADALARAGAELYSLGGGEFAAIGVGWTPTSAGLVGRELIDICATFTPAGNEQLQLDIGHVGPELTTDIGALRELAARALRLAARGEGSSLVGPDELVRTLAPATEIETAMRLLDVVERDDPAGPGHSQRVARLAGELAQRLRLDAAERGVVRLAGHLHDVGLARLDQDARQAGHVEHPAPEALAAYRRHPELGARYLRVPAGREVATIVHHHHERVDGEGFPAGRRGDDIAFGARVVAVAEAIDRSRSAGEAASACAARLREEAGRAYDPTVVDVALELLEEHREGDPDSSEPVAV